MKRRLADRFRWLPAALLGPVRRVQVRRLVGWGRYDLGVIRHNNERTTR